MLLLFCTIDLDLIGVVFEIAVDVLPKLDLLLVAVLVGILGGGTLGVLAREKGVLLG
jgi:hypothetical protein